MNGVCWQDEPALVLTIGQARSEPTVIDVGLDVQELRFTAKGEYLAIGDEEGVGMWRVKDWTEVTRMEAGYVISLAASKNGKWIAAGTHTELLVWNAETYEQVLKHEEGCDVYAIDFSPDSMRLVAGLCNKTAIVWDLATGKRVQILHHKYPLTSAKYSPRGDRIATATYEGPVGVWDSNDGRLLVDIDVEVIPWFTDGLLWSNDHIFVITDKIEEFNVSTGSKVSEWPVPGAGSESCAALPKHKQFIACSATRTVTFWDMSTHNQLPLTLQHPGFIHSIAFSPDDRFLAVGGGGKITIQSLSGINVSATFCRAISSLNSFLAPAFSSPLCPTPYFTRT